MTQDDFFRAMLAQFMYAEEDKKFLTVKVPENKQIKEKLVMAATPTAPAIKMTAKDVEVIRSGKQIVLPKDMSFDEGIDQF